MFKKNNRFKIKTPTGFEDFSGIQKKTVNILYTIELSDGTFLKCSENHSVLCEEGFVLAKDLKITNTLTNKSIKNISHEIGIFEVFDPVGVEKHSSYYSNGIVSHNCEFLGSSNTLISGRKLQQIAHRDPSFVHDMVRIYESPVKEDGEKNLKDHLYCIMVDVAEGKGLDSSAFQVIDMTAMPYRQVAAYSSSSISPILFPTVIYNTARMYNDAYILVEVNNTNQIAETLHADFEYENLWKVHTGNKKPQQLSTGFARGVQMGVKMSPQVKRIGCTNLRSLVEADKLILQDFNTYSELTTFIAQKNSWSAESGANDDMVMCLVMFAWVTTQKYFREIVNHDIRKQMQLENMNQIDEITPPEMMVEDGLSHGFAVMGGDVWEDAHTGGVYQNWVNDALKQF